MLGGSPTPMAAPGTDHLSSTSEILDKEAAMSLTKVNKFSSYCVCLVALTFTSMNLLAARGPVFQPQTRVGALTGDQWEPSIAADANGHVYIVFPEFPPSCKGCPSSTMYLITSSDNGATWSTPHTIAPPGSGQIDVQIKVDPDGR